MLCSDDSFIVSPFKNVFQFLPDVPYEIASKVLDIFNAGPRQKRDDIEFRDLGFAPVLDDICPDNALSPSHHSFTQRSVRTTRGLYPRHNSYLNPGYVTTGKPPSPVPNPDFTNLFLDPRTQNNAL